MQDKPDLKIDWASHEAAKYACLNWHYSQSLSVGKLIKVGVWENGQFIGVIIYSWGSNNNLSKPYGLKMIECCELVRVALTNHKTPVSRIMAISQKFLIRKSPGLRLIVSFADPSAGHHGGIYQANGWFYCGASVPSYEFKLNGKKLQKRAYTGANYGNPKMVLPEGAVKIATPGKHRYLLPLDKDMSAKIALLAKPYPKREKQAMVDSLDTAVVHHQPSRSNANVP